MEWSKKQERSLVTIVMPVCNEATVLEQVLNDWVNIINDSKFKVSLFIEDANSTDGTLEILDRFSNLYDFITVFKENSRDGFKNSLIRMFKQVKSAWIFVADSDGQYLAKDFIYFSEILENSELEKSLFFIKGVKINRNDNFVRRFSSFLMNRFIVVFIGLPLLDYNSSHYLIKTELINDIFKNEGFNFKYSINVEVTLRALLSNKNYRLIYVKHLSRLGGVSRGNPPHKFFSYGLTTLKDIWRLKTKF